MWFPFVSRASSGSFTRRFRAPPTTLSMVRSMLRDALKCPASTAGPRPLAPRHPPPSDCAGRASLQKTAEKVSIARTDGVSRRQALSVWPRIALLSFGSPAVQLAAMYRILVEERRWISRDRFLNALNYCLALPGPDAQLLATYVGWMRHGMLGGMLAGGLVILPGMICMMALSYGYVTGGDSSIGEVLLYGLKPAILVIVLESTIRVGRQVLRTRLMAVLAGLAFVGTFFFNLSFVLVVVGAALMGFFSGLAGVSAIQTEVQPQRVMGSAAGSRNDDLPDHIRPTLGRYLRICALWLALWFVPVAVLISSLGVSNVFSQISILFSKIAALSLGGPYAVNSYVALHAVESHGWLTHNEALDGLALAELAPGPVILFQQFVGFVAAYRNPGMLPPLVAGTLGGLLSMWVISIPTFLWIFLVGPFIERFRDNKLVNATLSAVTGGVLGVVLTFAIRFGTRTIFLESEPISGFGLDFSLPNFASADPWALVIALVAAIAMFCFGLGMVATLAASCAIGIVPYLMETIGVGSLHNGLLGLVAGAAIGFPAGPVAVWCLHLRIQQRRAMVFAIVAGSAIGDLIIAAVFFVVADLLGGAIASLQILKNPLFQGPVLILGGIALLFVVSRSVLLGLPREEQAQPEKWTYMGTGLAALIAVAASVTHPENLLAIGAVFTILGVGSDSGITLLAGFFIGTAVTWFSTIELLCHLGEKQGRQIMLRVMQALCVLCIAAGFIQLARAAKLFW
jgi:chromate transporter